MYIRYSLYGFVTIGYGSCGMVLYATTFHSLTGRTSTICNLSVCYLSHIDYHKVVVTWSYATAVHICFSWSCEGWLKQITIHMSIIGEIAWSCAT
jgi:hypothetical protein